MTIMNRERLQFTSKKIIPLSGMDDRWFDYMKTRTQKIASTIFESPAAIHDKWSILAGSANNTVKIDSPASNVFWMTNGSTWIDGLTAEIFQSDNTDADIINDVKIPPGSSVWELYAVLAAEDSDPKMNPRNGLIEYNTMEERLGFMATPTSVTDDGDGTITLVVDSLWGPDGAGEDHSGRKVRVWLRSVSAGGPGPQSVSPSVAFEELTVTFNSPDNEIATVAALGQSVISTTVNDYWVELIGAVPRKSGSIPGNWFKLADVTAVAAGNPITIIDDSMQEVIEFGMSVIDEVLEKCAHGRAKFRIQLVAAEDGSNESQFRIIRSDNNVVFRVDATGRILNSYDSLELEDAHTAAAVPLALAVESSTIDSYAQSIVGSLTESQKAESERNWNGMLSGGAVSGFIGVTIDVAAIVAWARGKRWEISAVAGQSLTDNNTNYVYVNGTNGTVVDTIIKNEAFDDDGYNLPLAIVVTSSGSITSITDLRQWNPKERRFYVTAGNSGAGPVCDFENLTQAVDWMRQICGLIGDNWLGGTIILDGHDSINSQIEIDFPKLTIRGSGSCDQELAWKMSADPLFHLRAAGDGFTVENGKFIYDNASSGTFIDVAAGEVADDVRVYRNRWSKLNADISSLITMDSTIRNRWYIVDNVLEATDAVQGFLVQGLTGSIIRGNILELDAAGSDSIALRLDGDRNSVEGNKFLNGGIIVGGDHNILANNYLKGNANRTVGISVTAPYNNVMGNYIEDFTANTAMGIEIASGALYCAVIGNILRNIGNITVRGDGIAVVGDSCTIAGNVLEGIHGDGIEIRVGADRCTVTGNTITNVGVSGASYYGIRCDANYCSITGNVVSTYIGTGVACWLTTACTYTICQCNVFPSLTDGGSNNMIGASATNNNIIG